MDKQVFIPEYHDDTLIEYIETKTGIYIDYVYVPQEIRHQGLGTNLLRTFLEYTDSINKTCYLFVSEAHGVSKDILIPFYKKLGFEHKPKIKEGYFMLREVPSK